LSVREAATRFSVSPATVSRWTCRWRARSSCHRRSHAHRRAAESQVGYDFAHAIVDEISRVHNVCGQDS